MVYKALQKNHLKSFFIINFIYSLGLSTFILVFGWNRTSFFSALLIFYLYAFLFWFSLFWLLKKKKRAWLAWLLKSFLLILLLIAGTRFFELSSFFLALSGLLVLFLSYIFYQIKAYPR